VTQRGDRGKCGVGKIRGISAMRAISSGIMSTLAVAGLL